MTDKSNLKLKRAVIKNCKEHYLLKLKLKSGESVGDKLFKMVVNVEKLLKMVKNGDFSKFVKKW